MASRPFDVHAAAREFASDLTSVLNASVCNGVRLNAVLAPDGRTAWVGYCITKTELSTREAFPLGIPKSCIYLGLSAQLRADDEGQYLAVQSSFMGLFLDSAMDKPLLHFDYEREKADGYPEAHLQVHATSAAWETVFKACDAGADRKRQLEHLHLPVGGRRFRPTLEDLIDFVIAERLVNPRSDWRQAVEQGMRDYAIKQMRAMIRRYPEEAAKAVEEFSVSERPRRHRVSSSRPRPRRT